MRDKFFNTRYDYSMLLDYTRHPVAEIRGDAEYLKTRVDRRDKIHLETELRKLLLKHLYRR